MTGILNKLSKKKHSVNKNKNNTKKKISSLKKSFKNGDFVKRINSIENLLSVHWDDEQKIHISGPPIPPRSIKKSKGISISGPFNVQHKEHLGFDSNNALGDGDLNYEVPSQKNLKKSKKLNVGRLESKRKIDMPRFPIPPPPKGRAPLPLPTSPKPTGANSIIYESFNNILTNQPNKNEPIYSKPNKNSHMIRVIPSYYKRKKKKGDFLWEIKKNLEPRTLYIFNDNEQDHNTDIEGGNSAAIRIFNQYSSHQPPRSAGISTGPLRATPFIKDGYLSLTPKIIAKIDSDVNEIKNLLKSGNYDTVKYSANKGTDILGTGIFKVGDDVKNYITEQIKALATIRYSVKSKQQNNIYVPINSEESIHNNLWAMEATYGYEILMGMPVRQLKEKLDKIEVSYAGIVDKHELVKLVFKYEPEMTQMDKEEWIKFYQSPISKHILKTNKDLLEEIPWQVRAMMLAKGILKPTN